MRYAHAVISSVLLLTVPSTALHAYAFNRPPIQHAQTPSLFPSIDAIPSYDEIIELLHDLESGELEKRCHSYQDVQKLAHFLIDLARKGVLPHETEAAMQLEEDIAALEAVLRGEFDGFAYGFADESLDQLVIPAIFYGDAEFIQCRNWFKKQFHNLKDFAKRHKKALIIAAAVVVATAVAVGLIAAASAAGAAGAAAAGSGDGDPHPSRGGDTDSNALLSGSPELRTAIDEHIASLKNDLVSNQLLQPHAGDAFSLEENGRIIGSLIAHDSFRNLSEQLFYNTSYDRDLERAQNPFSTTNFASGQEAIDQKFHTDYAPLYATHNTDFRTLSLQAHGETALAQGSYQQAIQDFERIMERTPTNPFPYLDLGVAHFGAGEYERALDDYGQFAAHAQKSYPLSIPEFSRGFAKGLPHGIYDSGESLYLFLSDLVTHPIQTGAQMWEALSLLSQLARTEEWSVLSEALAPEIHKLVKEWDELPSDVRGELAGYAFGKYGSDILIPGALAKVVGKGLQGAKELSLVYRGIQTAEKTLLLESMATLESGAKIAEVLETSQKTVFLGEELGFTAREMSELKQAGKLEAAINTGLEKLVSESESDVLKAAISQNRHVKMIRDYLDKPSKEIQKGINSYEKQIAVHKDKIANPAKHCPDWEKLDPRQREALMNKKWPLEIKVFEEQKNVLQSILNERLSHD